MNHSVLKVTCYGVSFLAFIGAGGYMLFGENRTLGVLLIIAAAILARVLILNIAERHDSHQNEHEERSESN